nr:PREDICTED: nuclear factor erythroid 2-related factor 1 [Lepisosteus oculatus]
MLYLKKYFTEGLIQFTILLSLIGVRVDVDSYLSSQLPPLREIILGPSSAYTQTQFHNLRNTLDGYGIHPKSIDLDDYFTARRLLSEVRALDRFLVPSTELSTWLVHRDPEGVGSAGQSSPGIALDNGGGLEDVGNPEGSAMRGEGPPPGSGYGLAGAEESLGAVAPQEGEEGEGGGRGEGDGGDDLTKEVRRRPVRNAEPVGRFKMSAARTDNQAQQLSTGGEPVGGKRSKGILELIRRQQLGQSGRSLPAKLGFVSALAWGLGGVQMVRKPQHESQLLFALTSQAVAWQIGAPQRRPESFLLNGERAVTPPGLGAQGGVGVGLAGGLGGRTPRHVAPGAKGGVAEENNVGFGMLFCVGCSAIPLPWQLNAHVSVSCPQLPGLGDQTTLSLQECLRLLEATFPFGDEAEFPGSVTPEVHEVGPSTSQGPLLSPLLPETDAPLDLEQQWQDIMAIMELQDMEVNSVTDSSYLNGNTSSSGNSSGMDTGSVESFGLSSPTPIHQDVSLHQASLPSCSQDFPAFFSPDLDSGCSLEAPGQPSALLSLSSSNSTDVNSTFGATNLTGIFLPPALNGTGNSTLEPAMPDPLGGLLEEAMLDEISLLDLAMEEGFSQAQASQLEEELDSDSGLSLDSSHSPVSPSSSETSSSSSSSSASVSFSEEGAVGYSTDSEAVADLEEGAVGGYQPEYSKFCRMSYQDPALFHQLPHLEHVSHNHTYNLPLSSHAEKPQAAGAGKKPSREKPQHQPPQDLLDKQSSRDERRARAMKIPFSNDKIINLPVEEFNELLAKHHLSEAQLALVRDIRRRGKNKMAAQNCRKRKLDTILNLEHGVEELRRDKTRLLKEKMEFVRSIRQMKQKVHSLYQEVFSSLRDEHGRPYPASDYALQYGSDGSVLLIPRSLAAEQARKQERKHKDRKK